jgi:hypothetical protein
MDSGSEHEDKFRMIAERRIRDAIESGELQTPLGPDQRLNLEDNPYVPEDWRMAFRVLQNSHHRPDWMELADEIENDLDSWRRGADNHFAYLRDRLTNVVATPRGLNRLPEEVAALKLRHQQATALYARQIEEINHKIHRYNATVPSPGLMRGTILADEAMRRWADRLPAYLNY